MFTSRTLVAFMLITFMLIGSACSSHTDPHLDARAVLAKLVDAGIPATNTFVQTSSTDPNHLLGRPSQYTSRVSFDLPSGDTSAPPGHVDRGGVVEVFDSATDAAARRDYIMALLVADPILGTESDYLHGRILVRVAGRVPQTITTQVRLAVEEL